MSSSPHILFVDQDDSFTYNLVHLLTAAGASVEVRPASAVLGRVEHDAVVLGPGHGRPDDAARLLGQLLEVRPSLPVLGVCLGHQAIATWAGGVVERSTHPIHGERVAVSHDGTGVFAGLPAPLYCARYNSLSVRRTGLPTALRIAAWSDVGEVMAIRHNTLPIQGIQFHPESVLSDFGCQLLENWLEDL